MRNSLARNRACSQSTRLRQGQALVEFGIIAFVLTLLLGAMLTFGFLLFGANVLQQAADVGAQELSRHPHSPTGTFEEALDDSGLFREEALVVPAGTDPKTLPLINRLLFSLYIYDVDIDQLRYPGTLVTNADNELTVLIPIVGFGNRDASTGVETISQWRKVVEEIVPANQTEGPYSLAATDEQRGNLDSGMVALRINYPHQSGALIAYIQTDQNGNPVPLSETLGRDDLLNVPVQADDSQVTIQASLPAGYSLVNPATDPVVQGGVHRGQYGLGEMQAFAIKVRPYRKVLSAQAIYRREVFE